VSYPQGGYPQQPYPGGGYPTSGGRGTNPATAIIAALLALAVTAFEIVSLVKLFDLITAVGGIGDLPAKTWGVIGTQALAGLLLLIGAILVCARKTAGAVLVIIGAIAAIAGFFLFPILLGGGASIGSYFEEVFKFQETIFTFNALTLIGAPLTLIFAVLPPTFNHLRGGSDDDGYGDPYPGSGGFPQQGYNNAPNSDPFPQQGYNNAPNSDPFPQQGYPQQGGYPPQQGGPQRGGGYPPQQQGW
jgi:hypothetical protein